MKLELDDQAFAAYAFYSSILIIKILLMAPLTAKQRFGKGVFANPEDTAADPKKNKVKYDDPDVERVRRAHLNDLENILPFFIIAFIFLFTNPGVATAKLVFQLFTGSRIIHTIVYAVMPMPQPSRALAWAVGMVINIYMAVKVLIHFM